MLRRISALFCCYRGIFFALFTRARYNLTPVVFLRYFPSHILIKVFQPHGAVDRSRGTDTRVPRNTNGRR